MSARGSLAAGFCDVRAEGRTICVVTLVEWLLTQGAGPAVAGLPVSWAANRMGAAASRWVQETLGRDQDTLRALSATAGAGELTPIELAALRALLSDEATWKRVAGGTTDNLEHLVASCFPPTGSRSPEESKQLASVVVKNLVGFQLSELDDGMFREYLAGLLERLHGESLTHIDEAFLQTHEDLVSTRTRPAAISESSSRSYVTDSHRVRQALACCASTSLA